MDKRDTRRVGAMVSVEDQELDRRKAAVTFVDEQFKVTETVEHLQHLMKNVTKEHISPETVNAACNCVQNLNLTIKTAIQSAKYLNKGQ